jgi:hypothetical protein
MVGFRFRGRQQGCSELILYAVQPPNAGLDPKRDNYRSKEPKSFRLDICRLKGAIVDSCHCISIVPEVSPCQENFLVGLVELLSRKFISARGILPANSFF